MYNLREEKREELLKGRKQGYIANQIGINPYYFNRLLNNNVPTSKILAMTLISISENIEINNKEMEKLLKYYFKEV